MFPQCRVYCGICIERLCGREELERVQQAETWECYLCSPEHSKLGLLCKRDNWLDMLKELFSNDYEVEYVRLHVEKKYCMAENVDEWES